MNEEFVQTTMPKQSIVSQEATLSKNTAPLYVPLKNDPSSDPSESQQKSSLIAEANESYLDNRHSSIKNSERESHPEEITGESVSVSQAVVMLLEALQITESFGVSGGAMAMLWAALSSSDRIDVTHCRHESGATFAAAEASLVSGKPVAAFCTAGPGLTNALTGMFAARGDGAKVVLLSACTSAPQRGRWAIQETSALTLPQEGLYTSGALFNYATVVESAAQLPQICRRLAAGFAQPNGFVAHLSFPTEVQSQPVGISLPDIALVPTRIEPSDRLVTECAEHLSKDKFAIWLGFGARECADKIIKLAEKTGAAVMCSPRGKGIFPESHPQFVGVTGLGGHSSVLSYMEQPPSWTLVLGTRLGEPTSFWSTDMLPTEGLIHVDVDSQVLGAAYPNARTIAVQADIESFLDKLLPLIKEQNVLQLPNPVIEDITPGNPDAVRQEFLIKMIQKEIVESSDAVVLAESGNSFTWSTHWLRFDRPNRYRVSTGVGAMGHAVTGVVGAAKARGGKAVAIVGDGAMLMNSEVSTAVKYHIPAVWIVLNDARYNMCFQGMAILGLKADALMPETDFVMVAKGMGANGIRVERESQLEEALKQAMASAAPFIIDVRIDALRQAPSKGRNKGLAALKGESSALTLEESTNNGTQNNVNQKNGNQGDSSHQSKQISFPLV